MNWNIIEHGPKFTGYTRCEGQDHNAYEIWAWYFKDTNLGNIQIRRATNNRKDSMADELVYEANDVKVASFQAAIELAEYTFLRFEKPVRGITDEEWHNWNDIVDPHNVKNMTSDYMIVGRPKGSKGQYQYFNNWNGKFGAKRWGLKIKPRDKKGVEDQLPNLRKEYPDYDIEMRQGSGTYFNQNRKRRGRR